MQIQSLKNKKVMLLCKLNKRKYREQTGSYLIHGANIIKEANETGSIILEVTTDSDYHSINEVLYVNEMVMEKIIDVRPLPRVVAQVKIPMGAEFSAGNVLVLDELQDPGNVGTILRTALALGVKNIFVGDGTVDIYNPKVVRAMQGVEFHLNFIYGDVYDYLSESSLPIITTFLDEDNNVLDNKDPFNLVIGNEGRGINPRIKGLAHKNKKIDIEFESLNVAVATAIILHELR